MTAEMSTPPQIAGQQRHKRPVAKNFLIFALAVLAILGWSAALFQYTRPGQLLVYLNESSHPANSTQLALVRGTKHGAAARAPAAEPPDDIGLDPPITEPVKEVVIATVNQNFLWRFDPNAVGNSHQLHRDVPGCTYQGKPLGCRWVQHQSEQAAVEAGVDATVWHAPTFCWVGRRPPGSRHVRIVASTESAVYYNCLDNPGFMSQFDMEMTYRMCSQVPLHYFVDRYAKLDAGGLLAPPAPYEEKDNALAWLSLNCQAEGAFSGRTRILKEAMEVAKRRGGAVKVLSFGKCSNNAPSPGGDKVGLFRRHKFCVAMENSIAPDYVTEKLWDALVAGCVPVYIGAPNVEDFLPHPDAIIHYGKGPIQTPEDLVVEMERLAANRTAYEAKLAWKKWTRLEDFPQSFRDFARRSEVFMPHTQCQACQMVASARARPRRFTTCLWNQTWMEHVGRLPATTPRRRRRLW